MPQGCFLEAGFIIQLVNLIHIFANVLGMQGPGHRYPVTYLELGNTFANHIHHAGGTIATSPGENRHGAGIPGNTDVDITHQIGPFGTAADGGNRQFHTNLTGTRNRNFNFQ